MRESIDITKEDLLHLDALWYSLSDELQDTEGDLVLNDILCQMRYGCPSARGQDA